MRRTREPGRGSDAGTTLTELMVVILIFSIVAITTATLTIGFSRSNAENVSRQDQIDEARTAVERMSKTVRTAVKPSQLLTSCGGSGCDLDAIINASDYAMTFFGNLDNEDNSRGPSRITYSVATSGADAGVLIEKVQRPDSAVPSSNGYTYCSAEAPSAPAACKSRLTVRRLAAGVQTATGTPLFSYYSGAGDRLTVSGTGLTSDQLEKVLSVELVVTVQSENATKPKPTTYIQRVLLPNSQAILKPGEESTP